MNPARTIRLDVTQRRDAATRLRAIIPMLEFRRRTKMGNRPTIQMPDGSVMRTLDVLAAFIAVQEGVRTSTVWGWYCRYIKSGYDTLAHVRSDRGRPRFAAAHPSIAQAALEMRHTGKFPLTAIHTRLKHDFGDACPCYSTLRSYLKASARGRSRKH